MTIHRSVECQIAEEPIQLPIFEELGSLALTLDFGEGLPWFDIRSI